MSDHGTRIGRCPADITDGREISSPAGNNAMFAARAYVAKMPSETVANLISGSAGSEDEGYAFAIVLHPVRDVRNMTPHQMAAAAITAPTVNPMIVGVDMEAVYTVRL